MKVEMIDYTGAGRPDASHYAACVLIFSKSTRLTRSGRVLEDILKWSSRRVNDELEAISKTLPSSWEFIHYTFHIEGVTRAFTHQLVRTRTASYAQQAMRVVPQEAFAYSRGNLPMRLWERYDIAMQDIQQGYDCLIKGGAATEDARGVLPTNILTNILMSANLRTLSELVQKRSSHRVQSEYRQFLDLLLKGIFEVHPWALKFFRTPRDLLEEINTRLEEAIPDWETRNNVLKLIDKVRLEG